MRGKLRERLRSKFGTIQALNEMWGTNLWIQKYEAFEDFEAPRSDIWHHPSLIKEAGVPFVRLMKWHLSEKDTPKPRRF